MVRRDRVGPHRVRGSGRGADAGPGVMVRREFRGAVLVLRRELHGGVRIAHGAHTAAGTAGTAATADAATGGGPVGYGNRSGGAAAGRRAAVQRRAAAARARATGVTTYPSAASVPVRRALRMRDDADTNGGGCGGEFELSIGLLDRRQDVGNAEGGRVGTGGLDVRRVLFRRQAHRQVDAIEV